MRWIGKLEESGQMVENLRHATTCSSCSLLLFPTALVSVQTAYESTDAAQKEKDVRKVEPAHPSGDCTQQEQERSVTPRSSLPTYASTAPENETHEKAARLIIEGLDLPYEAAHMRLLHCTTYSYDTTKTAA